MTRIVLKALLMIIAAVASSQAHSAKLYKWVDTDGKISYQDQPPPKRGKILSEQEVASQNEVEDESAGALPDIVIYTVDDCELCDRLVFVLTQNKIPYIELPLEDDRQAQSKILEKASSIIVPTIFIGDDVIQGGNEDNLKQELLSAGFEIEQATDLESSNNLVIDP